MKNIVIPVLLLLSCALASCHNYEREKAHNGSASDSTAMSDSLKNASAANEERTAYSQHLQNKIDSLQVRMNRQDSMYDNKIKPMPADWPEHRNHIKARINRMKERQARAGSISNEKWNDFKKDVDTAMLNIKDEWTYGE